MLTLNRNYWITLTGICKAPFDPNAWHHHSEIANDEHPNAWIECGTEKGPLYSIDIYSGGYALYTIFNNVDMEEELENRRINNVDVEKGFDLWKKLINGKIDKI